MKGAETQLTVLVAAERLYFPVAVQDSRMISSARYLVDVATIDKSWLGHFDVQAFHV